ncbi:MAG TPA: alpha/beta hydrolase [Nocardioides sp.]|nr:alpha/beta hydrolase [Nocardioides sp.]
MTTTGSRLSHATVHTVPGGDGLALHVREWGPPDGRPVLLIHGWSGNHMCWRHQVDGALVDEFRVVALDLRGHGMSDRPLDAGRYQDARLWAADIAAVIGQLNLERPTLVGWSYGGFVICDYLRTYGESAVSAINFVGAAVNLNERFDDIGPAFLSNAPAGADPDLPTRIGALRRFWRSMSADPLAPTDFETGLCGSVSVPPEVLGALISRRIESDPVLARTTVPILVSHGRQDQIVLPSMAEHILQACPAARASWYDRVGHLPFAEDPSRFDHELAELARSSR